MIQAYNHYLTEYSESLSKHSSAHKQKELKDVYSRIVNMNRQSAYYKLDLSEEKQFFSLSLKDTALTLADRLKKLSGLFDTASATSGVHSSEETAVRAGLINSQNTEPFEPFSIQVNSVATSQINCGDFVPSDAEGPSPASYRFKIQVDENEYEFSYKLSSPTTNRELLTKLADFINKSQISVRADIETSDAGLSRMLLSSEDTGLSEGEALRFSITDTAPLTPGARGLVNYFGLDRVARRPSNAHIVIDGQEHTSSRNEIVISQNIRVSLLSATGKAVTLSPETTGNETVKELESILESYNSLIDLAQNGLAGNRRSVRLQNELKHILSADAKALRTAGIHQTEDSRLLLDASALKNPENLQVLRDLFEEPDGLLARLGHKIQDIALNPVEYIDKVVVTYPNLSRTGYPNPYATSIYSGMLFSSYC